jgi:hypothetical protein
VQQLLRLRKTQKQLREIIGGRGILAPTAAAFTIPRILPAGFEQFVRSSGAAYSSTSTEAAFDTSSDSVSFSIPLSPSSSSSLNYKLPRLVVFNALKTTISEQQQQV